MVNGSHVLVTVADCTDVSENEQPVFGVTFIQYVFIGIWGKYLQFCVALTNIKEWVKVLEWSFKRIIQNNAIYPALLRVKLYMP